MALLDFLLRRRRPTASVAKQRLQIILAHERANRSAPDFLPALQQDIIQAVAKYVSIEPDGVKVQFERRENYAVLELNIALPAEPMRTHGAVASGAPPKASNKSGPPHKGGSKRHS